MGVHRAADIERRFSSYIEGLVSVIGHRDRAGPLRDYCVGLVMPGARKSVEPMAALPAPERTAAQHQSLLHFVGQGPWSDEKVLAKVREMVMPGIERAAPIEAWIVDDTSFPKQGRHSVGVAHQYCGQLGKKANCQVAVSLSIVNRHASLPVAYRLYLPKDWAQDGERRRKAEVPQQISFKTKPEIALEQIRWACEAGLPRGTVLLDTGYGHDAKLRMDITELKLAYVAGIQSPTLVRAPGTRPGPAPRKGRRGEPDALSVKEVAVGLGRKAWRTITWREGTNEWLSTRFARLRICVASRDGQKSTKEWLLIEWPEGEKEPTKYWLSTLPKRTRFRDLVERAKLRWRIERDYQELKQEVGLGHFEGRGWRGFHHHATLCIAAYGFLVSERETIPPSGPRSTALFPRLALPNGYRPRGSAIAASAAHPKLNRNYANTLDRCDRQELAAMSMLWRPLCQPQPENIVTQ